MGQNASSMRSRQERSSEGSQESLNSESTRAFMHVDDSAVSAVSDETDSHPVAAPNNSSATPASGTCNSGTTILSRRRRRTSSIEDTPNGSSSRNKRRHNSSTLRRLSQLGSSFVNSFRSSDQRTLSGSVSNDDSINTLAVERGAAIDGLGDSGLSSSPGRQSYPLGPPTAETHHHSPNGHLGTSSASAAPPTNNTPSTLSSAITSGITSALPGSQVINLSDPASPSSTAAPPPSQHPSASQAPSAPSASMATAGSVRRASSAEAPRLLFDTRNRSSGLFGRNSSYRPRSFFPPDFRLPPRTAPPPPPYSPPSHGAAGATGASASTAGGNTGTEPARGGAAGSNSNAFSPWSFGPGAGLGGSAAGDSFPTQAAILSRLLSVAAQVTAASLVGSSNTGVGFGSSSSESGGDTDNSFQGFLNRLNRGQLLSELTNSVGTNGTNGGAADGETGNGRSQNFFRMFRFAPPTSGSNQGLVPVLIVGVRVLNQAEEMDTNAMQLAPAREGHTGGLFDVRTQARPTAGSEAASNSASGDNSTAEASSSNGPADSTSASAPQAARDLSESIVQGMQEDRSDMSFLDRLGIPGLSTSRPRPRSVSAGSAGDRSSSSFSSESSTQSSTQSSTRGELRPDAPHQSWIVYVVGGSYPSDHPLLLAPSLFTEDPTYEDLLILENFLGQAKPPVATKEDLDIAGGTVVIAEMGAEEDGDASRVITNPGERCQVCLSSYEAGEECRKLKDCGHLFHRECIDQWLTTGRNSCPLCRGEGVKLVSREQDETADGSAGPSGAPGAVGVPAGGNDL